MYAQPEATRRLLTTFYRSGKADASLFRHRPVNFNPGWMSFPFIAKTLLATAIVLVGAGALLLTWVFRRKRKAA
jgi:hypothetical protein